MKIRYRIMIVIIGIASIIVIADRSREPIIPVAKTPIQSLDQYVSEGIVQQPDGVTSPGGDPVDELSEVEVVAASVVETIESNRVDASGGDTSGAGESTSPEASISYDAIVSNAEGQLAALQSSCQGALMQVYFQYVGSKDAAEKKELIGQGKAELARCDSSFDEIMSSLETLLTTNGLSTSIIGTYRTEYMEQKALAKSIME